MRKSLITFSLHVFSILALGQEQVKSFYFPPSLKEPTQYSAHQFDQFKQSIDNGQVHILEINAFTDSSGSALANYTLATARLTYFTSRLFIDSSVKLNAYALQRPYILNEALNSRRVDIIYKTSPRSASDIDKSVQNNASLNEEQTIENYAIEDLGNDPEALNDPKTEKNEMTESVSANIPFIINVQFKEGTSQILPISYREVTQVAQFMNENPQLKAEIRGHVCCGKNIRMSKSRAKSVYKRLIKIGISKDRLSYIGKSNTEPLVYPEITETDRQKNRRVDVKFSLMNE